MSSKEYHIKFKAHLNDVERYRKFVSTVNKSVKGRLLFWQEKALEEFCNESSLEVPSFSELKDIFNVCEVHGVTLQPGEVKVFRGEVDYTREFNEANFKLFPNSWLNEINGPLELQGKYIPISFCTECRAAQKKWESR